MRDTKYGIYLHITSDEVLRNIELSESRVSFHSIRNERQVEWRSPGDLRNYYVNGIVSVKWQVHIDAVLAFHSHQTAHLFIMWNMMNALLIHIIWRCVFD